VPRQAWPIRELPSRFSSAIADLWALARTRGGLLVALLCVVPFGAGTEAGLIGAISNEWSVTPDQLAGYSVLGAPTSIVGALIAGWLSTRIRPWRVYLIFGWLMIGAVLCLTFAPRAAMTFLGVELLYRALASGCYAALLGIVMSAIGKGAASTKAAGLWSLANLAVAYPALLEGTVHDHAGTRAMLLTDVVLGVAGFGLLLAAARWLGFRLDGEPSSGAANGPGPVSSTAGN
jgi:predicted MFS family arabinose efflux permease